jgi:hypothetical protein
MRRLYFILFLLIPLLVFTQTRKSGYIYLDENNKPVVAFVDGDSVYSVSIANPLPVRLDSLIRVAIKQMAGDTLNVKTKITDTISAIFIDTLNAVWDTTGASTQTIRNLPLTSGFCDSSRSYWGTAVQLESHACKYIIITTIVGNTDTVYIGNSNVTTANGIPLSNGDQIRLPITNTNFIYFVSSSNGANKIRYYWEN